VLLVEAHSSYQVFANAPAGFEQLADWLRREQVSCVHACLEATGSDMQWCITIPGNIFLTKFAGLSSVNSVLSLGSLLPSIPLFIRGGAPQGHGSF
jgi:hypothetical protein